MLKRRAPLRVVVIWIDWYPYHVARFRGLASAPTLAGQVAGIELVGGIGVHAGLKFREDLPADLPVDTLMPETSWREANKFDLTRKLWSKLSELNPRVVLVPGYYTLPGIAAALWARTHGATSVLMTESTAFDHPRTGWKEWVKGWSLRALFDWAIAGGKAHVQYLHQLEFPAHRIAGSYDVVDNDFFHTGAEALRTSPSGLLSPHPTAPYFVYVGRLAPEKNVAGLMQSWVAYRDAGGTWPLILVGDGPEASRLRELAAGTAYAQDVVFPGLKNARELVPFYAFAGCFVLPSTREPWGLVVNEAMAAGLPVLVSNRCGCASNLVLEGRNGFVFDPHRPGECTALLRAMENLSGQERRKMGLASADIIRDFTPLAFGLSVASILTTAEGSAQLPVPGRTGCEPVAGGSQ